MSSQGSTAARARTWPKKALLLFIAVVVIIYGLVFLTGDKSPTPKLGIDLQGGTRVTLVPQGEQPTGDQLDQARRILENRVNGMGVSGAQVVSDGDTLVISVPGEDSSEARTLGQTSQLLFRPVMEGGMPEDGLEDVLTEMADRWVSTGILTADEADGKLEDAAATLEQMGMETAGDLSVNAEEPAEPANSIEEADRRQETTDVLRDDRQSEDTNAQIAASFLMTCSDGVDPLAGADDPARPLVSCSEGQPILLEPAPLLNGQEDEENGTRLTGDMIDTDSQIFGGLDSESGQIKITFRFKTGEATPGGETWQRIGQEYAQKQVAITLDSQVLSAPVMQSPTPPGRDSEITGDFTESEASDLANNLRYGALPLSFTGENGEQGGTAETISPTMGSASLQAGLIAGLVGLILVAIWSLIYYRGFGVVAVFSLVASGLLIYGALILLGRWIDYSLDLAGIAGLIIGICTTADSFVVYFERIKDVIQQGHSFRSAVPRAWKRARTTIITGNVVSIAASLVLYFVAVGDVKGFAFTLGLSTVFDVVIAFLVTAPLVILMSRSEKFASPRLNGLRSAFRSAERRRADEHATAGSLPESEPQGGISSTTDTGKDQ
ncbi:protein translocase subunit SecD [Corynebacterium glyciniphilum]|uniref:protein translocase subunit SecD n=1 Tax=Corynebacterium glyciniphilum TaxID=1404244 RepID=UPI00264F7C03|nr:protein translocase subunit SecD [Corynebacterium glyciniphilum]MDN5683490.1 protein translocase subunit SecD [Corynebacterium glyciniphilum]